MNHLLFVAFALTALLALSACGADGAPTAPTTTTGAAVGLTVGSGGVQPSAAVGVATSTQTRSNVTLTGGLTVGVNR
jgi:hypothetical protein